MRAQRVAKWQQKCRVDWDATDGRNGGAQRTAWEVLMEMERFKYRAGEEDLGTVALVLDLAKAFERVILPVDHHGHPAGVKVELLASTFCAAGRVK